MSEDSPKPTTTLQDIGAALVKIGDVLDTLPDDESRLRVLNATAILNGLEIPCQCRACVERWARR